MATKRRVQFAGVCLWFLAVAAGGSGWAGPSGPEGQALAEVVLTSGERFEAVVLEEDASSVTFRTSAGQVRKIDRQLIAPAGTRDGETPSEEPGLEDPSANRLLLMETARPLGRGNGSVAAHYFLAAPLGTVSYGLTDQISLGAGLTAFPGSESQVAFLYAKAGWTLAPRKALAVGLFHARGWGEEDGVAVLYAVSSFGPPSRSLSLGMALAATREIVPVYTPDGTYTRSGGRWNLQARPLLFLGGTVGLGKGAAFVAEGWLASDGDDTFLPIGAALRLFRRRVSLDLGVVTEPSALGEGVPFLPWVSLTFHFGPGRADHRRALAFPLPGRRPPLP